MNQTHQQAGKHRVTRKRVPQEFRVVALRECVAGPVLADAPEAVSEYWQNHIAATIDPAREHLVAFLLNTRCRLLGHHLVGIGTLDSVLLTAREVFRAAIIRAAHSVIIAHNHPSGDATPSRSDWQHTRGLIRAGRVVGIELLDHIVIGGPDRFASLRAMGCFDFRNKAQK